MKRKSRLTIAIATAVLGIPGGAAVCAQDKYSLKSPSGIEFSDFKGYEDWSVVSDCGHACHVAVKAKDHIFHPYQKR